MPKIVTPTQSYSNGHLPYQCLFYYLARTSMHDVAREFGCAVRMRRTIRSNVPKTWSDRSAANARMEGVRPLK